MNNHGNSIISLGSLCRWLASEAETLGVNIFPGFPAGDLIEEEGEIISQQFKTDIGFIDILAKDKKTKNYVVIELKKNQTSDDTIGQLLRYMGWIKKNKKDDGVKGVIVAGQFDTKLDHAKSMIPNSEVFLYEVDFKLKEYK